MKAAIVTFLMATSTFAARPRGVAANEVFLPVKEAVVEKKRTALFLFDVGLGGFGTELRTDTHFNTSIGFGWHLNKHVDLAGELSLSIGSYPGNAQVFAFYSSLGITAFWNLFAWIFPDVAIEVGPEFNVAVGFTNANSNSSLALPHLRPGIFLRYMLSPRWSIGLRARATIPFYFGGGIEPNGSALTLSFAHTF